MDLKIGYLMKFTHRRSMFYVVLFHGDPGCAFVDEKSGGRACESDARGDFARRAIRKVYLEGNLVTGEFAVVSQRTRCPCRVLDRGTRIKRVCAAPLKICWRSSVF